LGSPFGAYKNENEKRLGEAKELYSTIANERLANIASGDNWNPWLAMRQAWNAPGVAMAETTAEGLGDSKEGYASKSLGKIADRSQRFDSAADQAEQYFIGLEAAKAQGPEAVVEFKKANKFPTFKP
jgi:hypothetical protein